jgi:hypothetical protein
MASRLSRLDRLWIASLMKDADHYDSILASVVEQRVGKSVQQNSSECAMDNLKCQRTFFGQRDRVVDTANKIIS